MCILKCKKQNVMYVENILFMNANISNLVCLMNTAYIYQNNLFTEETSIKAEGLQ